ncbi:uncharacterized protein LOC110854804 [Folsomia candida]|uniref:uncharacterized protein LOC110854804 n=1 Tax=Folsomia candida TaxID=158441 RepID=UPI000B90916E|nr:uncharacterized protein LOC110854804 [Folsomia candida]
MQPHLFLVFVIPVIMVALIQPGLFHRVQYIAFYGASGCCEEPFANISSSANNILIPAGQNMIHLGFNGLWRAEQCYNETTCAGQSLIANGSYSYCLAWETYDDSTEIHVTRYGDMFQLEERITFFSEANLEGTSFSVTPDTPFNEEARRVGSYFFTGPTSWQYKSSEAADGGTCLNATDEVYFYGWGHTVLLRADIQVGWVRHECNVSEDLTTTTTRTTTVSTTIVPTTTTNLCTTTTTAAPTTTMLTTSTQATTEIITTPEVVTTPMNSTTSLATTSTTPMTTTADPCPEGPGLDDFLHWAFTHFDEFIILNHLNPSPPIVPYNIDINTDLFQLSGNIRNSFVTGMSNALQIYEISSDLMVPQFQFSILFKHLELHGLFNLSGSLSSPLPMPASGAWSITDFDLKIDFALVGFAIEDGYINLERYESRKIVLTPNYSNSQFSMESLSLKNNDGASKNLDNDHALEALMHQISKSMEQAGSNPVLNWVMTYLKLLFDVTPLR